MTLTLNKTRICNLLIFNNINKNVPYCWRERHARVPIVVKGMSKKQQKEFGLGS